MIRKATRRGTAALLLVMSSFSVAAAPNPFDDAIDHARFIGARALDGEVFHVQGLAQDEARIWVTSVDQANHRGYLHVFDRATGRLLRRIDVTDGLRYHPGGISLVPGALWVPVAELRPDSSAVLMEIDTRTLQVRRRIRVADHLGCVAAAGDRLVAGNWDSRLLYVFDLSGRTPVRIVPNPSETRYQDMKFVGDQLVAGGTLTLWSGAVDWLAWPSLRVTQSLHAGAVGWIKPLGSGGPYTGEGMAIEGRDLYLLPEDGPTRVLHFRLDAAAAGGSTRS